jgi:hypothetical protein
MTLRILALVADFITTALIVGLAFFTWRMIKAQQGFNGALLDSIRNFDARLKQLEGSPRGFAPPWKPDPDCRDCREAQRKTAFALATCLKHGPMGWAENG